MKVKSFVYFKHATLLMAVMISFTGIIIANPKASFIANQNSGCSPLNVTFTNTSTGATSYYWDLGNGNTSTLTNPNNFYTAPGSYTIVLIAIDGNGLRDTVQYINYISVSPKPSAEFYSTNNVSCLDNNSFTFVNTSTGASSYLWDFGDGTLSYQKSPVHNYSLSGKFTTTLIVTNSYGCSDQKILNQYITVHQKPDATIIASATSSCHPNTIFTFSCNSSGIASYQWNFGDGTYSTQSNPSHTYSSGGNYPVSLIIFDNQGCSDTSNSPTIISVGAASWATFNATNNIGCIPLKVDFQNNTSNSTTCTWLFGDGTSSNSMNPSHTYNIPGQYAITLITNMANGCSDTLVKSNFVKAGTDPVVNFTANSSGGCAPFTAQFINLSSNFDSCQWSFGDGTTSNLINPSHLYASNGNYTITLACWNMNGCTKSVTIQNMISVSVTKSMFSASPRVGCPPLTTTFNDFSTGNQLSYYWDFGDGTTSTQKLPSHTYITSGKFDVKLIVRDSSGCTDTLVKQAYIQTINPAANYVPPPPTTGCAPLTTQFTDGTVGAIAWLWDFGDGTTSSIQAPVHTYSMPGTYVVSLTTTLSGGGCTQTISNFSTFIVHGGYAGFTHSVTPCPPYVATFQDTSANAVSWFWDFGDGTTSTQQNPSHTYSVPSYHSVTLTITTSDGCSYTTMQSNGVYFSPFGANFYGIPDSTTFPTTVHFFANSSGATGWSWDFGDGNTSLLQNPSHYYAYQGNYVVTLTVTNGLCTLTYVQPSINFGVPDTSSIPLGNTGLPEKQKGCVPLSVNFSETIKGSVSWHWDFGDGDTSLLQFPEHTYLTPGIYTVTLTTYDTLALPSILQMDSIVIASGPKARFSFAQQSNCQNIQVQLTDSSTNASRWLWNFGDGTTDTIINPNHIYTTGLPNYVVSLMVSDTMGCTSSISTSIFANFISPLIASETEICGIDTVHFSTSLQNYPFYFWNFGDGTTSTATNPTHVYNNEGNYQVSLIVTDSSGCSQTFILNPPILVRIPKAEFVLAGPAQGCNDLNTSFQNLSINADSYLWDFGDGSTSTSPNPSHHYISAGIYDISLSVYRGSCMSNFTMPHAVKVDTAHAEFTYIINDICMPVTATYTDLSTNAISWRWYFGDGDSSSIQNPVHTFYSAPCCYPILIITDKNGCTDTTSKSYFAILKADFQTSVDSGCVPVSVHFTNKSKMSSSWLWDFGDGTTSTQQSPTHTYSVPGDYMVKLIASSTYAQCSDSMILPTKIKVRNPVAAFSASNLYACAPSMVVFTDSSLDADSYLWDFGDGSTSTNSNPSHIYTTPGIYDVSLIVTSNSGCADTIVIPKYITVLGPITKFAVSSTDGCQPFSVNFTDQSINAIDWSWNFGDGSSDFSQNSSHTYPDTGTFTVILITHDTAGCSSYYEYPQKIIVHPKVNAGFFTADTLGCSPFITNFINMSSGMSSSLWQFGDGTTSTSLNPSHVYATSGIYNVSLFVSSQFGCSDSFTMTIPIHVLASPPQPSISASTSKGCSPLLVSFTNNTTAAPGAGYFWDFGNGITSTDPNPNILFTTPGFYSLSLTISYPNGCSSNITLPAYLQVLDSMPPAISNILSVSVTSNSSVEIQWENNAAIDLGGYILYRKNLQTGVFENIYVDTNISNTNFNLNPTYTDTGLYTLSNVYTYKLLTFDQCGNAIPLDQLKAHSTINVSSQTIGNSIYVSWNAYGGCSVSSYQVFRCSPPQTNWQYVTSVPKDSLNYLDSTYDCPQKFGYRIMATDLCGNLYTSYSDTSNAVIPNSLANQVVEVLRSTVENNLFVLTEWKQPQVHPNKVVQFDLYRSTDNVNFSYLSSVPALQTDYMDYDVDVQKNYYYYKILVINTCNTLQAMSDISSSILLKGEMDESRKVSLKWTPYAKWDSGVEYYIIEKKDDNGNWLFLQKVDGSITDYNYRE